MYKYKNILNISKRQLKRRFNGETRSSNLIDLEPIETLHSSMIIDNFTEASSVASDKDLNECDFTDDENNVNNCEENIVNNFLKSWALRFKIKFNALNALLVFLKSHGYPFLPKDSRTLLETPTERKVLQVFPGEYVHIGVKFNTDTIISSFEELLIDELILDINIDGVPISKSSNNCFWPILGRLSNIANDKIFVIGIYQGYAKPKNFTEYLNPLVEELQSLLNNYNYASKVIKFKIGIVIGDAPARASILGIKSHTGYFGCSKCIVEGEYINHRMCYLSCNAAIRSNKSFRNKTDENHHIYTSPMEVLDIDMIKQFPLDYLHVVCLGVVKKLMKMWIHGDIASLLPSCNINKISSRLVKISKTQPDEFQRRIRPLSEMSHFKGTEFRTFLIYAGPLVLKYILPIEKYNNFLLLHVGIMILCNEELSKSHVDLAETLLQKFVTTFAEIYGNQHVVYNIHSIIHLASDVRMHGCLDRYSAYPFESFMSIIKGHVRKGNQPLAQICNRIYENISQIKTQNVVKYPIFKKPAKCANNKDKTIFREIVFKSYKINNKIRNQWFLTSTNKIIKFHHSEVINGRMCIYGAEIETKYDFYTIPVASNNFSIFQTTSLESTLKFWPIDCVAKKLFFMENGENDYVFMPLLHSTNDG